jgi:hypothetical protein
VSSDNSDTSERESVRPEASRQDTGATKANTKATPEAVIGRKGPTGRLNKRLILGVIGSAVVGMLVLNFLPSNGKTKGGSSSEAVYANDTMPQDVKEMAMKLPEVPTASAASSGVSGYGRTSTVNNPFAGYPTASSETRAASGRETSGQASGAAGRDYQGNAAADALLEADKAARRAPMEVATKLTAGLTPLCQGSCRVQVIGVTPQGVPPGEKSRAESEGAHAVFLEGVQEIDGSQDVRSRWS